MLDDNSTSSVTGPSDVTSSSQQETSIINEWNQSSQRRRVRGVRRLWRLQGHWKDLKGQHGQWTCFLCCHVRTGTIVIGLWHMVCILEFYYLCSIETCLI